MKILHVGPINHERGANGPSHSVRGLAAGQAEIGMQVAIMSSMPFPPGVNFEPMPGILLFKGPRRFHSNPWLISKQYVDEIVAIFGKPDLVNFHSFYTPFESALARRCRQLGWPYILTPRGELTHLAQSTKRAKKCIANFLRFSSYAKEAAAIHALTSSEADQIKSLFHISKFIIAPNGVDDYLLEAFERLYPVRLNDFTTEDDLLLGFMGRIDLFHKGIDLLLNAMGIVKTQPCGNKIKLFLIGPFRAPNDKKKFQSLINKIDLHNNVFMLGPKYGEEKLKHILACDVFVHPSRFEGMPMAVLEAMAMKIPCMVTPGTNISDIVVSGGGWKCEPSPESIAMVINEIYNDRKSLKERGEKAHLLMESQYSWRHVAKQLKKEYKKILSHGT